MLELIDYTSNDEIRAALGVSEEELEDATLAKQLYAMQLGFELGDITPELEQTFMTIKVSASKTAEQRKLYDVVKVFSAYVVAKYLLVSLPLFAPKRITDGRSEVERFTDPFQDVRDGVAAGYLTLRNRVIDALAGVGIVVATASGRSYFATAGLATDPVTGA